MAHSEKCPVCEGTGKYEEDSCHGCYGRGWIVIGYEPMPYIPQPYYPTITPALPWPRPYPSRTDEPYFEVVPYYESTWKAGANEFYWGNITIS